MGRAAETLCKRTDHPIRALDEQSHCIAKLQDPTTTVGNVKQLTHQCRLLRDRQLIFAVYSHPVNKKLSIGSNQGLRLVFPSTLTAVCSFAKKGKCEGSKIS